MSFFFIYVVTYKYLFIGNICRNWKKNLYSLVHIRFWDRSLEHLLLFHRTRVRGYNRKSKSSSLNVEINILDHFAPSFWVKNGVISELEISSFSWYEPNRMELSLGLFFLLHSRLLNKHRGTLINFWKKEEKWPQRLVWCKNELEFCC